jgi:hypothetical protein
MQLRLVFGAKLLATEGVIGIGTHNPHP